MNNSAVVFQRLDKWLFFARAVKSRTLAAKHVIAGHVRVNGKKVDDPAKRLQPGDTLTITLERDVRVLQVISPGIRRGPFSEASQLYLDLTPQPTATGNTASRDKNRSSRPSAALTRAGSFLEAIARSKPEAASASRHR